MVLLLLDNRRVIYQDKDDDSGYISRVHTSFFSIAHASSRVMLLSRGFVLWCPLTVSSYTIGFPGLFSGFQVVGFVKQVAGSAVGSDFS
ncbi:hypothetical protein L6452_12634 [Arctium lappa]|uniref:Uncharacterized protein n=1 Tax=Arctium lappa TaxID=4217 RepID=A0ACB9DQZ2_ARCLA|nr:hypothetical protein L6452_12634 [Arctium lappa]